MIKKVFYIAIFVASGGLNAQTMITDRPDQTESSSSVKKGSLQIETGFLLGFTEGGLSSERQLLAPATLFRYGLLNGLEIRVLSQFESLKDKSANENLNGIGDLEVGTKIELLKKENVNTEIAFLSHIILPTGTKVLSNDLFGTINKLSISHQLSDTMGLGYNAGYDFFGEGKGNLTCSISLGISITDQFGFYIEPYGNLLEFKTYESSFDAGITYLVNNQAQLDFSFGTGINHNMNYLSVGYSLNIAKINR